MSVEIDLENDSPLGFRRRWRFVNGKLRGKPLDPTNGDSDTSIKCLFRYALKANRMKTLTLIALTDCRFTLICVFVIEF